jgi:hypothetical protein
MVRGKTSGLQGKLLLMAAAACRLKPSVVFVWGTHVGASARIFYECDRAFKRDQGDHRKISFAFLRHQIRPRAAGYDVAGRDVMHYETAAWVRACR